MSSCSTRGFVSNHLCVCASRPRWNMKKSHVRDPDEMGIDAKDPNWSAKNGRRATPQMPAPHAIRNHVDVTIVLRPLVANTVVLRTALASASVASAAASSFATVPRVDCNDGTWFGLARRGSKLMVLTLVFCCVELEEEDDSSSIGVVVVVSSSSWCTKRNDAYTI